MSAQQPTILDVVDNAIGGTDPAIANRLSARQIGELADRVSEFIEAWSPPEEDPTNFLGYSGGWVASSVVALPEQVDYFNATVLYYPRVLVHDPVANWFSRDPDSIEELPPITAVNGISMQGSEVAFVDTYYRANRNLEEDRHKLGFALSLLHSLAPLIREGMVIPAPSWRIARLRQQQIRTSIRYDIGDERMLEAIEQQVDGPPTVRDNLRGFGAELDVPWVRGDIVRAKVQDPSYYLNKTLAVADYCSAVYVPTTGTDIAILRTKAIQASQKVRSNGRASLPVPQILVDANLPFLAGMSVADLVEVRRQNENFAEFRTLLANSVRQASTYAKVTDGDAVDAFRDELEPTIRRVERSVSTSSRLSSANTQGVIALLAMSAATVGGLAAGVPVTETVYPALGGGAATWAWTSLRRSQLVGADAVIAGLIKRAKKR